MDKIESLEKERQQRNISSCLSYDNKIKLNVKLDNTKFFNKAMKEISKKVIFKKSMLENTFEGKKKYLENLNILYHLSQSNFQLEFGVLLEYHIQM